MGGSSSSQSKTDGEIKNSSNKQNNYGLINLASENLDSSNWNFLEIFTFALVWIGCLYFLRLWCIRRRQKKLQSLRDALQSVQVVDVQPHAALRTSLFYRILYLSQHLSHQNYLSILALMLSLQQNWLVAESCPSIHNQQSQLWKENTYALATNSDTIFLPYLDHWFLIWYVFLLTLNC